VSRPTEETFAMRGRARATFDRAVPCLRTRVCGDAGVNQRQSALREERCRGERLSVPIGFETPIPKTGPKVKVNSMV
jgi:hypothetical protein